MSNEFRPLSRRYSTRFYLSALVAAVVVPLIAFTALVVYRYAKAEQVRLEQEAVRIAGQTGLLVEAELKQLSAKLEGLASSAALARDDFEQFHGEAKLLTQGREETIILRDMGVRQLLNNQLPFGAQLPSGPPFSADEQASFNRGAPYVSDVYSSPRSGEARVVIALPILRDGSPKYILGITIPTSRVRDALMPAVPAGYVVAVGDRRGAYVARSARHDDVTGKPGLPEYVQQVIGRSGSFKSANFEGNYLLAGYYRSDLSGWFYTANIPSEAVERPLQTSLLQLAGFGAAAFVLSAVLALIFSRGIVAAAGGLATRARALGNDQPVRPIESRLAEFALVGDALVAAGDAITARSNERAKADVHRQLLVNELNHRVKNSLTIAQSIASQTIRGAKSLDEARSALSARLVSLSRTHDVLTKENWEGANVEDIVAHIVEPYATDRISASGPSARLLPGPAVTLSLFLYELMSNAVKYGALHSESGTIKMRWSVGSQRSQASQVGRPRLLFRWEEAGGPAVTAPAHRGFGSRLFAASFSSDEEGKIEIDYPPDGVVCEIEMNGVTSS